MNFPKRILGILKSIVSWIVVIFCALAAIAFSGQFFPSVLFSFVAIISIPAKRIRDLWASVFHQKASAAKVLIVIGLFFVACFSTATSTEIPTEEHDAMPSASPASTSQASVEESRTIPAASSSVASSPESHPDESMQDADSDDQASSAVQTVLSIPSEEESVSSTPSEEASVSSTPLENGEDEQTAASGSSYGTSFGNSHGSEITTNEITGELSHTAYWTSNGKSYHFSRNCRSLSRSKNVVEGTLQDALNAGKQDPCNICAGG